MKPIFRRVAVIGKYPGPGAVSASDSARQIIESIAQFVTQQDCELTLEAETAAHTGLTQYHTLDVEGIGRQCDLCLVVGGDGTMLGVGRRLAGYGTPLVGINQGRLGFITDIPLEGYQDALTPILHGDYEEDVRPLMQACVMRGGECVFEALASTARPRRATS